MPDDFSIGQDTEIFGRSVRIFGTDEYTREFYRKQGIELPADLPGTEDNFERSQKPVPRKYDPEMKNFMEK